MLYNFSLEFELLSDLFIILYLFLETILGDKDLSDSISLKSDNPKFLKLTSDGYFNFS